MAHHRTRLRTLTHETTTSGSTGDACSADRGCARSHQPAADVEAPALFDAADPWMQPWILGVRADLTFQDYLHYASFWSLSISDAFG